MKKRDGVLLDDNFVWKRYGDNSPRYRRKGKLISRRELGRRDEQHRKSKSKEVGGLVGKLPDCIHAAGLFSLYCKTLITWGGIVDDCQS